jgi:phosphoribosyl 1,2-cyclic phosphodiesterase
MSVDIRVLGSGSSGNCYWLSDGETPLLLECGLSIAQIRRSTGFRLSEVAGVLVSHEHGDHAKAAKDVAKAGIDLYASPGTISELGLTGHRVHAVKPLQRFVLDSWAVMPWEAVHDAAEPLGFLLASKHGFKVLYATDTAFVKYRFKGLTHILLEANWSEEIIRSNVDEGVVDSVLYRRIIQNHMSLERAVEMLKANDLSKVQQIILIHLSDSNADPQMFKDAIARVTGKPVYIAGEEG